MTIQLEATTALLEQAADRDAVLARVRRAHELAREGPPTARRVSRRHIKPVAAAADGEQAVAMSARHRPDVVLMDLRMPKLDRVEATRQIRAAQPATEVVVLTTHPDEESILDALRVGALGYLTKDRAQAVHYAYTHGLAD